MDENTPLVSAVIERAVTNDGDSQATVNCQPIKGPPTGKQYVRCPCNCLLVCNESTSKVGCPRPECQKVIVIREEDGVGFMGGSNRFLQGPATHGTFGTPQSLRLSCGNCNSPFSIPSPESHSFGRMNAFTALLSGRNASNAAGLITARCPHCHKVTSVGPAYARAHWIGYGVLAIVAIIIAISVTAGTAEAAIGNNALYFLWSSKSIILVIWYSSFHNLHVTITVQITDHH
ncbi:unnamed protein product [Schistosoma mattheei]|uniref:Phosphatidylinositol-4,5-bisphosphate 4-phosphatase n=1 Tax=Schistosoma mattheei TaxID=31246 RepID=A0A183P1M2_9TREM|nr:unnamed protein product [Schistosoma mattheei]